MDCEAASFLDQNLANMIYYVHVVDELQTFKEYEDDRSVMFGDSTSPTRYDLCGRRSYSLVTYDRSPRPDITQKMYITPATNLLAAHGSDR